MLFGSLWLRGKFFFVAWIFIKSRFILVPVNCEEEYGEWSECAGGSRTREEVVVSRGGITAVCPALTEGGFWD